MAVEKAFETQGDGEHIANGVNIKYSSKKITLTATDGTKVGRFTLGEYNTATDFFLFNATDEEITVVGKEVARAVKILKTSTEEQTAMELIDDTDEMHIKLHSGEITIDLNQVTAAGKFPGVKFLDDKYVRRITVNRKALVELLKSVDFDYVTFKVNSVEQLAMEIDPKDMETILLGPMLIRGGGHNSVDPATYMAIAPIKH
jgi:DNA polymerase III sliding clamp (beta) subunit (PCNA family)